MSRRAGDRLGVMGTELVRRQADGAASTAVVEAVADARGTSPLSLPPLAEAVDPDALDALCAEGRATGRVTFDYAGYRVQVGANQTVTVAGTGPQGPAWAPDGQR